MSESTINKNLTEDILKDAQQVKDIQSGTKTAFYIAVIAIIAVVVLGVVLFLVMRG